MKRKKTIILCLICLLFFCFCLSGCEKKISNRDKINIEFNEIVKETRDIGSLMLIESEETDCEELDRKIKNLNVSWIGFQSDLIDFNYANLDENQNLGQNINKLNNYSMEKSKTEYLNLLKEIFEYLRAISQKNGFDVQTNTILLVEEYTCKAYGEFVIGDYSATKESLNTIKNEIKPDIFDTKKQVIFYELLSSIETNDEKVISYNFNMWCKELSKINI